MNPMFPKTLESALEQVWQALSPETKHWLGGLPQAALRDMEEWETLVMIRNLTGLNEGNTELLAQCAWYVRMAYPLDSDPNLNNHFYDGVSMGEIQAELEQLAADYPQTKPTLLYLRMLARSDIAAHVILECVWDKLQQEQYN